MNIIFDVSQIDLNNIVFAESKKNIIMHGNFTKIIYSNPWVSINGLYIHFPINIQSVDQNMSKYFIKFNMNLLSNYKLCKSLHMFETQILDLYQQMYKCNKPISLVLNDQLNYGNIKLNVNENTNIDNINLQKLSLYLKISGVWETQTHIGITYKIVESIL